MELSFKIQGDRLISGSILSGNSGNVGTYNCNFDILDNTDLVWFCVFKKNDSAYQQVINNNKCVIPKEVVEESGDIKIGCYGTGGEKRVSTNWLTFSVADGAYTVATAPTEPTPDVWEELVMNSVPYISESGNWYVYDKEKKEYVDSGISAKGDKGDKGDKGEAGYSDVKRFPYLPQINITTEELVRYVDVEKIDDVPISKYGFTCAKILLTNSPQSEMKLTEFQVKLNKLPIYLSTPTEFLYKNIKQYWTAHFDMPNCLALGHKTSQDHKPLSGEVSMTTNLENFTPLTNVTAFRFISISQDIPVGTNIKVWFK